MILSHPRYNISSGDDDDATNENGFFDDNDNDADAR